MCVREASNNVFLTVNRKTIYTLALLSRQDERSITFNAMTKLHFWMIVICFILKFVFCILITWFLSVLCVPAGDGSVEPRWCASSVSEWLCPLPIDWRPGAQWRHGCKLSWFPASGGSARPDQHAHPAKHPVLLPTFLHLSSLCRGPPPILPVRAVQSKQGTYLN